MSPTSYQAAPPRAMDVAGTTTARGVDGGHYSHRPIPVKREPLAENEFLRRPGGEPTLIDSPVRSNRQDAQDAKKTDSEEISKALLGDLAVITDDSLIRRVGPHADNPTNQHSRTTSD